MTPIFIGRSCIWPCAKSVRTSERVGRERQKIAIDHANWRDRGAEKSAAWWRDTDTESKWWWRLATVSAALTFTSLFPFGAKIRQILCPPPTSKYSLAWCTLHLLLLLLLLPSSRLCTFSVSIYPFTISSPTSFSRFVVSDLPPFRALSSNQCGACFNLLPPLFSTDSCCLFRVSFSLHLSSFRVLLPPNHNHLSRYADHFPEAISI